MKNNGATIEDQFLRDYEAEGAIHPKLRLNTLHNPLGPREKLLLDTNHYYMLKLKEDSNGIDRYVTLAYLIDKNTIGFDYSLMEHNHYKFSKDLLTEMIMIDPSIKDKVIAYECTINVKQVEFPDNKEN